MNSTTRTHRLGLPLLGIVGLALLAVPRVVLHDLGLIHEGTLTNALFVFVPPLIWIAVVVALRTPRAFLALVMVGFFYGVLLGLGHVALWDINVSGDSPQLGGNLADANPLVQAVLLRGFTFVSSLVTGTAVGAIAGGLAVGLQAVLGRGPAR